MLRASIIMETTFKKYQQNLKVKNNNVYSYNTLVAKISGDLIKKVSWNVNGKTTSPIHIWLIYKSTINRKLINKN